MNWGAVSLISAALIAGAAGFTLANHMRSHEVVVGGAEGAQILPNILEALGNGYVEAPRASEADIFIHLAETWRGLDPIARALCEPDCSIGNDTGLVVMQLNAAPQRGRTHVFLRYGAIVEENGEGLPPCVSEAVARAIEGFDGAVAGVCGATPSQLRVVRRETFQVRF
ncbi:MAG: hypothetical protein AAFQ36_10340 [Pseudomonadota bacterium]